MKKGSNIDIVYCFRSFLFFFFLISYFFSSLSFSFSLPPSLPLSLSLSLLQICISFHILPDSQYDHGLKQGNSFNNWCRFFSESLRFFFLSFSHKFLSLSLSLSLKKLIHSNGERGNRVTFLRATNKHFKKER